jgi:hypothetical protein
MKKENRQASKKLVDSWYTGRDSFASAPNGSRLMFGSVKPSPATVHWTVAFILFESQSNIKNKRTTERWSSYSCRRAYILIE